MAESTVKILKSCIQKQVDRYGQDWDLYLHSTAFAIRSNINGSTKFTPAELILGENLKRPIDISCDHNIRSINKRQAKEFASSLVEKIEKSANIVNENVTASRAKMKAKYDRKNSSHEIMVGDKVMLWWPYFEKNIPRSFQPKWKGPWVVTRLIEKTNCTIENDSGETKNVHMNQLKPIVSRNYQTEYPLTSKEKLCISFDEFCSDNDNINNNDENINDTNEGNDEFARDELINFGWCNLDEFNILPHRTRNSR